MSYSKYSFLALVPLLSLMAISPGDIKKHSPNRGIASLAERTIAVENEEHFPKYISKSSKINREALYKNQNIDLTIFSEHGLKFRDKLMKSRKEYKVDEVSPDKVEAQNKLVEELVLGMVLIEEDFKLVKEKKLHDETGLEIANTTMNELKVTLESILVDQEQNEFEVLKAKVDKEEVEIVIDEVKEEVVATNETTEETTEEIKEETKVDEKKSDDCSPLTEQNKVLTTQVETLVADNKKIMETMMSLIQMMLQQQGQIQQRAQTLPFLSGPEMVHQYQLPMMQQFSSGGNWAYIPQGYQMIPSSQSSQPALSSQLGSENYFQHANSQNYNLNPQHQGLFMPSMYDMNIPTGHFGGLGASSQMFNFGQV